MRFSRSVEAGSKLVILIYKKICLKPRHHCGGEVLLCPKDIFKAHVTL